MGGVRVYSLTVSGAGDKSLSSMEKHGKRLDQTSKARKINNLSPLVYGSLDLSVAFQAHIDGVNISKANKRPCLHALVQFPTSIPITAKTEQLMLDAAVKFINQTNGGDAVFAARLDRDEKGRHTVDVFYAPRYEKVLKDGSSSIWMSTTKHGKEACLRHEEEIRRRIYHKEGERLNTSPRAVGMAVNSDFHEYLLKSGFKLAPKAEKIGVEPDRVSPEIYGAREDLKRDQQVLKDEQTVLAKQKAALDVEKAAVASQQAQVALELMKARTMQQALSDLVRKIIKVLPAFLTPKGSARFHEIIEQSQFFVKEADQDIRDISSSLHHSDNHDAQAGFRM